MRTYRFPPSPTGALHLGHLIGPLLNYSLAKSQSGEFILRIEDTDAKRNKEESADSIMRDFRWLGIKYDRGPEIGKKGEYFQSERLHIYKQYVQQLLDEDKAYKAYETAEERQAQIAEERKKGGSSKYNGAHANLTKEEQERFETEGRKPVVRLRVPKNEWVTFEDKVYGKISINTDTIGDFIIQRSDGMPMYNLAVVVDDHLMGVTDVVRGFDHLNNTPKQILIYKALGWDVPTFGHHASLLKEDGKGKLSKRHGAKSLAQYRAEGYLPEAIFNYIIINACSFTFQNKDEEIMTREEIFSKISIDKVLKTNSRFNPQKLDWFNGQHMRKLSQEAFAEKIITWLENDAPNLQQYYPEFNTDDIELFKKNKEILLKAAPLIQERITKFMDIFDYLRFMFVAPDAKSIDITPSKHTDPVEFLQTVKELKELFENMSEPWTHEVWEQSIRQLGDKLGWKHADLFMALRLVIAGTRFSPPLYECMEILGKEECVKRIQNFIAAQG